MRGMFTTDVQKSLPGNFENGEIQKQKHPKSGLSAQLICDFEFPN